MQTVFNYEKVGQKGRIEQFVLLSTSPRRRELLAFLNPSLSSVEVDERALEEHFMEVFKEDDFLTRAAKVCCEITKAKSDMELEADTLYISADTMVISDGKIFNKPVDLQEARQMLYSYFGKSHDVVTAVCLRMQSYLEVFYTVARIEFAPFYPELEQVVEDYLTIKQPLDKAGAYGFQELDPRLIKSVTGDIHTIIGLPVAEVSERIFKTDVPLQDEDKRLENSHI